MPEAQPQSPFPKAEVIPAETPGSTGLMTLASGVAVLAALYFGREVFLPIVIAVLLAFVLAPFVDLLRRLRLGRVPGTPVQGSSDKGRLTCAFWQSVKTN